MTEGQERHREQMARQFGENIARYRERRDMSQADLAREMAERGWDWWQSTVFKIERGDRRTEATEAHDLAAVLGVPIDRLFWPGPEQSEMGLADRAIGSLRQSFGEAAWAIARLIAAQKAAGSALQSARESRYERVRQAAGELEAEIAACTVDAAADEGTARFESEAAG
jgi:transcriptional regulator with XRE-family HTH domain